MTKFLSFIRRKDQPQNSNGRQSPDERQREFLRVHEARMQRVDEALDEARRAVIPSAPDTHGEHQQA
jgi:hypothetical protein